MATAAGMITALKERKWKLSDALKKVSAAGRIDQKKLNTFRNNARRRLHDEFTQKIYADAITSCRAATPEEMLKGLTEAADLLADPAFHNKRDR